MEEGGDTDWDHLQVKVRHERDGVGVLRRTTKKEGNRT